MTELQAFWLLLNITKDEEEEYAKFQMLLRFINPIVAKSVFDEKHESTESNFDDFMDEINEHTSTKVTLDDLQKHNNVDSYPDGDLDIIESV